MTLLRPCKSMRAGFVALAVVAMGGCDPGSGKPEVSLHVPATVNLGAVPYGGEVAYSFEVSNGGERPVIFTQIKATCSCTTSTQAPLIIGANETGVISGLLTLPEFSRIGADLGEDVEADLAGSVIELSEAGKPPVKVHLRATLVLPASKAVSQGDGMMFPIHALYRGRIESIACYPDGSDRGIPVEMLQDQSGFRLPGSGLDGFDAVFVIRRGDVGSETFRFVQSILCRQEVDS